LRNEYKILKERLKTLQQRVNNARLLNQEAEVNVLVEKRRKLIKRLEDLRVYCCSENYNMYGCSK